MEFVARIRCTFPTLDRKLRCPRHVHSPGLRKAGKLAESDRRIRTPRPSAPSSLIGCSSSRKYALHLSRAETSSILKVADAVLQPLRLANLRSFGVSNLYPCCP